MNRPIVAILLLFALTTAFSRTADAAWSPYDGASGQTVLRLRGAFVPDNLANTPGPGWMAGGGVGFGIQRVLLLTFNFDHYQLNDRYLRSVEPWTVKLEVGKPFQNRVAPHFELGTGVYRRSEFSRMANIARPSGGGSFPIWEGSPRRQEQTVLLGFNYGLGFSAPVAKRVMADIGLRYHKTLDRDLSGSRSHSLSLSVVEAGLTWGLR